MHPGLLVKLRPVTPWRLGPGTGARSGVDSILHSDALYSALTLGMRDLGMLEEWLEATAEGEPAVRITSAYPFSGQQLLIVPPKNLWPPVPTTRVRWKAARFVPLTLAATLVKDADAKLRDEDAWILDAESECLLMTSRGGKTLPPFRIGVRKRAAVDRMTGAMGEPEAISCLEFTPGSGMWFAVAFANEEAAEQWRGRLKAVMRLLADSGIGGERSRGWGRSEEPEFVDGRFPELLMGKEEAAVAAVEGEEAGAEVVTPVVAETAYWMLSLFTPGAGDEVDWERGAYTVVERSGRVAGHGGEKLRSRMVGEGSVVLAAGAPVGAMQNVAPEGVGHAVYRTGYALAIPIGWRVVA